MDSILSAPRVSLGALSILRIYTGLSLLYFVFAGAGAWSLDALREGKTA
jgi:hypothetical protein